MDEECHPGGYCEGEEYLLKLAAFLARTMPHKYSSVDHAKQPAAELRSALLVVASRRPDGRMLIADDPSSLSDEDPRNTWAYEGRINAPVRPVLLRRLDLTLEMQQFWGRENNYDEGGLVDHHTTGSAVWDSAVVLADFLTLPPTQLLAHHANYTAEEAAEWAWSGKSCVELGAGLGLPSCTAAILGAQAVVTDGDGATLSMARENAAAIMQAHPGCSPIAVHRLRWGEDDVHSLGVDVPCDLVCASDVCYVLDNPGAWGKLVQTIDALSGPKTVILFGLAERGNKPELYVELLRRIEIRFVITEADSALLHPSAPQGAPGRIDYNPDVGSSRIFCLAKRPSEEIAQRLAAAKLAKQQQRMAK